MAKNQMPGVDSHAERASFARNFRRARMKLRLRQGDIHQLTGIAQSHISEIEAGASNIALDTMVKLAAVVKTPLWKLFQPDDSEDDEPLLHPRNQPRRRDKPAIDLAFSPGERRALKKAAEKAGLTIEELVRKALSDAGVLPRKRQKDRV